MSHEDFELLDIASDLTLKARAAGRTPRASPLSTAGRPSRMQPGMQPVQVDLTSEDERPGTPLVSMSGGLEDGAMCALQEQGQGGHQQQQMEEEEEEEGKGEEEEHRDDSSEDGLGSGSTGAPAGGRAMHGAGGSGLRKPTHTGRPSLLCWAGFGMLLLVLAGLTMVAVMKEPVLLGRGKMAESRVLFGGRRHVEQQLQEEVASLKARLAGMPAGHKEHKENSNSGPANASCEANAAAAQHFNASAGANSAAAPAMPESPASLQQLLAEQQQQLLDWALGTKAAQNAGKLNPSHTHDAHAMRAAAVNQDAAAGNAAAAPACWHADATTTRRYATLLKELTHLASLHRANTRRAAAAAAAAVQARLAPAQPAQDSRVVASSTAAAEHALQHRAPPPSAAAHRTVVGFVADVRKAEDAAARVLGSTMSLLPMRLAEIHILLGSTGASPALRGPLQSLKTDMERAAALLADSLEQCEDAVRSAEAISLESGIDDGWGDDMGDTAVAGGIFDAAVARSAALSKLHLALKATRTAAGALEVITAAKAWAPAVAGVAGAAEGVGAAAVADVAGGGCSGGAEGQEAEGAYHALVGQLMGV